MPRFLPVPSLYDSSLKVIEDDFIIFVRDEMCLQAAGGELFCSYSPEVFSDCVAALQSLVSTNVPVNMRKDLLERILKKSELSCSIRFAAVEILHTANLPNFAPGTFPHSFHPLVLSRLISECEFLKYLDLTSFWVRGTDKRYLTKLFSVAMNLTAIVIPQICDDGLLSVIGRCCAKLSFLDVQDSAGVTETGVCSLIFADQALCTFNSLCRSLIVFKLGGPQSSLAPSCVALLLRSMPFLSNLGPYTYCGNTLQLMLEKYTDSKATGLLYAHDIYTSSAQIDAVLKLAPRLRGVYLDTPQDLALPLLNKLKVEKFKVRKVFWPELYRAIGQIQSITVLELLDIRGNIDLAQVSQLKSLKKLSIHNCDLVVSTGWSYYFRNLTFFEVYHTELSDQLILHLLTHCPVVKHLGFGSLGEIGDEEMIPILSTDNLALLEELWIARAQYLTEHTLAALLDFSPGIKSIGKLSGWGVSEQRVDMFQKMIDANNWDLKLWGFFREL